MYISIFSSGIHAPTRKKMSHLWSIVPLQTYEKSEIKTGHGYLVTRVGSFSASCFFVRNFSIILNLCGKSTPVKRVQGVMWSISQSGSELMTTPRMFSENLDGWHSATAADKQQKCSTSNPLVSPSGVIVGTADAKTTWSFLFFFFALRVTNTNNTGQNERLFIHVVYNGDMKADRNGVSQPLFPGRFCAQWQKQLHSESVVYKESI